MRIGTWNLQGLWDQRHAETIAAMDCDVLLLTEVSDRVQISGMVVHPSEMQMARRRFWAAVASKSPLVPLSDPHGASAMAEIGQVKYCSSILPWRSCGSRAPWVGTNTAERTLDAVAAIEHARPEVWGGDWNHAMSGREYAGSIAGRNAILASVDRLSLSVSTADEPHRIGSLFSIDHIALPQSWTVKSVEQFVAEFEGTQLSDHDAYVVETA